MAEAEGNFDALPSLLASVSSADMDGEVYELSTRAGRSDAKERPIVGPVLLGLAGLAGAGIVGATFLLAGCDDEAPGGECRSELQVQPLETAIYGGLSIAALTGAVLWFSLGDDRESATEVGFSPTGVLARGRF